MVTPEMIEAGCGAALQISFEKNGDYTNDAYVTAIYLAMKALDPEVERLREALAHARGAIASMPEDALGWHEPQHEEDVIWPLRDELLHMIDAALAQTQSQAQDDER
jgi:hypothetical protein